MKFLKRTILIIALLGIFLLQTSCGDDGAVNRIASTATTASTTSIRATTVSTTSTTATTPENDDSWIVSQNAVLIETGTESTFYAATYTYRYTITIKKDKPSDQICMQMITTDVDGEWVYGSNYGSNGNPLHWDYLQPVQENPDGTATYTYESMALKKKDEFGKPYNQKFQYRFALFPKAESSSGDTITAKRSSKVYCYSGLPC